MTPLEKVLSPGNHPAQVEAPPQGEDTRGAERWGMVLLHCGPQLISVVKHETNAKAARS